MANFFKETRRLHAYGVGAICAVVVCLGAQAQTASAPIPNFASDPNTNWRPEREDGDDFLPPTSGPGPVISHPDHPYRPNGQGDDAAGNPTYRVGDLSNPILQPWVIEQMKLSNDEVLAGNIPFEAQERCYPPGVPAWNVFRRVGGKMTFFVQTPEKVLMIWNGDNQVRHVYLNVPHSMNPRPTWHGESVGHYEGDTLVVDTIAVLEHPLSFVDNYRTPHTDQLHVVERFQMIDADTVNVNIYVEDPGAFTMPWNAVQRLYRATRGPIEETICAEGNPDYFNLYPVPIPLADVPDF
ncbi:MAG: hypothetical protein O7H40_17615 [Gammaproteobacteria bacterium]|nr:hypothetical protein [Gammaproteobacteria bacterium]